MSDKFYLDENEKEMEETAFKRLADESKNVTQTDGKFAKLEMVKGLLGLDLISQSTAINEVFGEDKDLMELLNKYIKENENNS